MRSVNMEVMMPTKTRICMLCGETTTGSVGAAGLRWKTICQPCKDVEDGALADRIEAHAKTLGAIMGLLERKDGRNVAESRTS